MRPSAACWAPLAILVTCFSFACEESRDQEPSLPPADATYTVRGMVRELPAEGRSGDLLIHHEAMDDFVDKHGDTVGMKAMVMPFTPAANLSLEGLSAGERVRFTFEVRWEGDPMMRVTHLEKLPPGTKLDFEK
jgi:Cu/Ag efflux protein CusF